MWPIDSWRVPPGLYQFAKVVAVDPVTNLDRGQCSQAVLYSMFRTSDCVVSTLCSCPQSISTWSSFAIVHKVSNCPPLLSRAIPFRFREYILVTLASFSPKGSPQGALNCWLLLVNIVLRISVRCLVFRCFCCWKIEFHPTFACFAQIDGDWILRLQVRGVGFVRGLVWLLLVVHEIDQLEVESPY